MNPNISIEDALNYSKEVKSNEISKLVDASKINPFEQVAKPPAILDINGTTYGTLGNFSLISGKAKAKKSFFLTLIASAVLDETNNVSDIFKTYLNGKKVIYFDTEQSNYHVNRLANRVVKLVGLTEDNNKQFDIYGLRKHSPKDRLDIINHILENSNDIGLVIIDGIADLSSNGYNDENDAIMLSNKLMYWTETFNIHIITILHQNKGDNNAKGHFGGILSQKAETVLNIAKTKEDKEYSFVSPAMSRGIDIDDIYFTIDQFGVPYITDAPSNDKSNKKELPEHFTDEENIQLLKQCFSDAKQLSRSNLSDNLKHYLKQNQCYIGNNKIREWITAFLNCGYIKQDAERKPYYLNIT